MEQDVSRIGVIICTYGSADVIEACLDSLLASQDATLHVVVCDNASPDHTVALVTDWAKRHAVSFGHGDAGAQDAELPFLTMIQSPHNLGFAGGVNMGLRWFLSRPEIDLFWVLNPDAMVTPQTAATYVSCAAQAGPFSLMGGRTCFVEAPGSVQSDGGRVRRGTGGVCLNVNHGVMPDEAVPPSADSLDFLSGANMIASRLFLETVGLMQENYFLYYEEVDWAYRRGSLPLVTCPEALVYHHGGTAIGSTTANRAASGFANYFNYRNRMRFVARFTWWMLPVTYAISMAQIFKMGLRGGRSEVVGALLGLHHLPPPAGVRSRIAPESQHLAFGR